ncbi:30221_t:CDS:2, partial [Gigaspora margarita]
MDLVTSEIDWTNKLTEYKNVFALSTEEFKKFAITQNEKVSRKDKEIAQLLKTDANIVYKHRTGKRLAVITKQKEVTKKVLIKQECGYQDYGIQELTNKIPNLEAEEQNNSKGLEMKAEEVIETQQHQSNEDNNPEYGLLKIKKDKEYSANNISINMHERIVTTKQEEKLKEFKQGCSRSRDQDLETTRNISYKKKGKAKQVSASVIQEKKNCALVVSKKKDNNKEVAITIDNKTIKDINRVFQKLQKKGKLINPKDKEDLKTIQELYKTDLNIQLEINDLEHTTKLKKYRGCRMNEDLDTAVEHCTFWKQLRKVPLESIMRKKHHTQSIADTLHIDNLQMPIFKIVTREEELINMHLEESQAAKKL